jgi:hypothetical protein
MTFALVVQIISDALAVALVIRLMMLRLHNVYRVFCAFVVVDLLSSIAAVVLPWFQHRPDYRVVWMSFRAVSWVLALWMLYSLIDAMLVNLPGVLRLSRKVLGVVFLGAAVIALLTAPPEYSASALANAADPLARAVVAAFVVERAIFMAALIVLVAMLVFILWFPVQMPRNLAVFSIGFLVFFTTHTGLPLWHTLWPKLDILTFTSIEALLLASCYAYWLLFINRAGEEKPVRIGHSWGPAEQRRMIGQLEAMNDALLRAARR